MMANMRLLHMHEMHLAQAAPSGSSPLAEAPMSPACCACSCLERVGVQIVAAVTERQERPEVPADEQLPGGSLGCLADYTQLMRQCWAQVGP